MTYDELVTNIRNYMETDANVLSNPVINTFILMTENKILREIDLEVFRQNSIGGLTAGNRFLTMPSDILTHRYMLIRDTNTNEETFLDFRDVSFLKEYWEDSSQIGKPKYYGVWNQNTFLLAPTPNVSYSVELGYIRKPAGLTPSNQTTWLSLNAPEVLLYGCLVQAYSYTKGPLDMLGYFANSYKEALAGLGIEQQGRRRRDEYRDGLIRTELLASNPISPNEAKG
jgi:hypothetical protein